MTIFGADPIVAVVYRTPTALDDVFDAIRRGGIGLVEVTADTPAVATPPAIASRRTCGTRESTCGGATGIGAGDAFNAGYQAARLAGRSPGEALEQGSRCGAGVATTVGDDSGFPALGEIGGAR